MTNQEKLNKAIEQDINLKDSYNEIIRKIEEGAKMKKKNSVWKYSLLSICLVVVISSVLFLNYQNHNKNTLKNKPYVDEKNNVILNINEITNRMPLIDAYIDIKTVIANDTNFPLPYKKGIVDIPKDLDKTYKYIFYFILEKI